MRWSGDRRCADARLGQQVLVDPKPGANTIVGSEIVAKAPPDGYTFLITTNSTHTNNPSLYAKLPFDPAKDLIPVSLVSLGTILVVAKADAPFSDLQRHGQVGEGPRPARHLRQLGHRLERPSLRPDVRASRWAACYSHVPYRGDVPAIQDVAERRASTSPGRARPAPSRRSTPAASSRWPPRPASKRSASMPQLPTFAEQLVAGFDLSLFVAAYAPAGTPAEIVDRMSREIKASISEPAVAEKLIAQGQTPVGSTPKELGDMLARETPIWAELIRQSGAKVE